MATYRYTYRTLLENICIVVAKVCSYAVCLVRCVNYCTTVRMYVNFPTCTYCTGSRLPVIQTHIQCIIINSTGTVPAVLRSRVGRHRPQLESLGLLLPLSRGGQLNSVIPLISLEFRNVQVARRNHDEIYSSSSDPSDNVVYTW